MKYETSLVQKIFLIVFGIFISIIILEACLFIGSKVYLSAQNAENIYSQKKHDSANNTYVILALGESTTAELYNGQSSWPRVLEKNLKSKKTNYEYIVIQEAIPSTDTREILYRLNGNLEQYSPDMVITMMGINDEDINLDHFNKNEQKKSFGEIFRSYKLFKFIIQSVSNQFKKPLTVDEHLELADMYLTQEQYDQAKREFRNIILKNPDNIKARIGLARSHLNNGEYDLAQQILEEIQQQFPKDFNSYLYLAKLNQEKKKYEIAEKYYKLAIEVDPNSDVIYSKFGLFYGDINKYDDAIKMLRKSTQINPKKEESYQELGVILSQSFEYKAAELIFRKVIEINPYNEDAYAWLAWVYINLNEPQKAQIILDKGIELNPNSDIILGSKALIYEETGDSLMAKKLFNDANNKRIQFNESITSRNYLELNEILRKNNVEHVVMQYPMRSIDSLKVLFKEIDSVFFIENEESFMKTVKEEGVDEVFIDLFGGDFGHCTFKGNQLIAQNVAHLIITEIDNS